jgi:hypothetical protein
MFEKWVFAAAAILLVVASCAGLSGHSADEEVAIVVGTITDGVLVDDHGATYMLAPTGAGKEALTHSGDRMIVTGHLAGKKGKQTIEVTSYQIWKQSADSGEEDDSD